VLRDGGVGGGEQRATLRGRPAQWGRAADGALGPAARRTGLRGGGGCGRRSRGGGGLAPRPRAAGRGGGGRRPASGAVVLRRWRTWLGNREEERK
jgi:hypothetical protein